MKSELWPELRTIIGDGIGLTPDESPNQIWPGRFFKRLEDFDDDAADTIQAHYLKAFGHNDTPPPRPQEDETADDHVIKVERWLFRHNFTLVEAKGIARSYVKEAILGR